MFGNELLKKLAAGEMDEELQALLKKIIAVEPEPLSVEEMKILRTILLCYSSVSLLISGAEEATDLFEASIDQVLGEVAAEATKTRED